MPWKGKLFVGIGERSRSLARNKTAAFEKNTRAGSNKGFATGEKVGVASVLSFWALGNLNFGNQGEASNHEHEGRAPLRKELGGGDHQAQREAERLNGSLS